MGRGAFSAGRRYALSQVLYFQQLIFIYAAVISLSAAVWLVGAHAIIARHVRRKRRTSLPSALRESAGVDPRIVERMQVSSELALQAGAAIMKVLKNSKASIECKANTHDLVTATDKANEKLIFDVLKERFPADQLIGEEGCAEAGEIESLRETGFSFICDVSSVCHSLFTLALLNESS